MFITKHPLSSLLACAMISLGSLEGIPMTISAEGNVTSSLSTYSLNAPDIKFNGKPYDQSLTFLQNADTKGTKYTYKREVNGAWEPLASAPTDAGHYQLVATTTVAAETQDLADFEVPRMITLSPEGKKSETITATSIPAGLTVDGLYYSFIPGQTAMSNPLAQNKTTGEISNDIALKLDFANTTQQTWKPKDLILVGADGNTQAKLDEINQSDILILNPSTGEISLTSQAEEAIKLAGELDAYVLACKSINGTMLAKYVQIHIQSEKPAAAYISQSIQEGEEMVSSGPDHATVKSSTEPATLQLQAQIPEESQGNWYCNKQMILSNEVQPVQSFDPEVESSQSFVTCALNEPENSETLNVTVNQGSPSPLGSYNFTYQYKTAEGTPRTLLYVMEVDGPSSQISTMSVGEQVIDLEEQSELTVLANREGAKASCTYTLQSPMDLETYKLESVELDDPEDENSGLVQFNKDQEAIIITPPALSEVKNIPLTITYKKGGSSQTVPFTLKILPAIDSLGSLPTELVLNGGQPYSLSLDNLPEEILSQCKIDYDLVFEEEYSDVKEEPKSLLNANPKGKTIIFNPVDESLGNNPIRMKMTINYYGPTDVSNMSASVSTKGEPALSQMIEIQLYTYPKSITLPAAFHLGVGETINLNESMRTKDGRSLSAAPNTVLKAEKEGIIKVEGNCITALSAGETWLDAAWSYESQGGVNKPFLTAGMEIAKDTSAHANGILIHVSDTISTKTESDDFYITPLKPFGTIGEAGLGMGNFTTSHTYGIMNDVVASVASWKKADLYVGGRYIKDSECTRQLGDLITNPDRGSFYPGKLSFNGNYTGDFYVPTIQSWNNPFDDIKKQADSFAWNSYIPAASIAGLMRGVQPDHFEPARTITRGEWILAMYRMAGEPDVSPEVIPFADVPENSFYYKASKWAKEHKISYGDGTNSAGQPVFKGQSPVQRQQAVSFLYRLGLNQGWITEENLEEVAGQYKDGININPGNLDGVNWALDNLVITGKGEGETKTIDPTGGMLRGDATKPLVEGYLILNDPVQTKG